jgi:hypothetical protein
MDTSAPLTKKQLTDLSGGLFLMIIFTTAWVIIGEAALKDHDHGATAGAFGIIIVYFIISYIKLNKIAKSAPEDLERVEDAVNKVKKKRFYIVFALEGVLILVAQNVLANTGHQDLFFGVFALIVGLHFFPLGKIFNHTFYYAIGAWICLVAILGFILIYQQVPLYISTGAIGIGCALATAANGIRIILLGGLTVMDM